MLRRPPTVLGITAEDVATYEDRVKKQQELQQQTRLRQQQQQIQQLQQQHLRLRHLPRSSFDRVAPSALHQSAVTASNVSASSSSSPAPAPAPQRTASSADVETRPWTAQPSQRRRWQQSSGWDVDEQPSGWGDEHIHETVADGDDDDDDDDDAFYEEVYFGIRAAEPTHLHNPDHEHMDVEYRNNDSGDGRDAIETNNENVGATDDGPPPASVQTFNLTATTTETTVDGGSSTAHVMNITSGDAAATLRRRAGAAANGPRQMTSQEIRPANSTSPSTRTPQPHQQQHSPLMTPPPHGGHETAALTAPVVTHAAPQYLPAYHAGSSAPMGPPPVVRHNHSSSRRQQQQQSTSVAPTEGRMTRSREERIGVSGGSSATNGGRVRR
ncbi:Anaphase-promoting complex, subunit CDC26 [Niveomyces insectorum RCEF 264]|uniref:Anaphase-promoting complex, subunit CDC26 n=1 Tax=Niveomyces insectorum RCEF 264 TaxID=1081102 RepID=A0A162J4V3_9HYPO|nr:Anaphase-promoting complex, subunit CDC26 [Niveomyces insectorum RCEF 264]